ncbi:MAG: hypothetical protein JSV52_01900 [Candidatus Zixiibacteriota bacterium]|nr:MAG: hypothetical protein JSV52_01900 [candidate division Zixibacteria bacterium]
MENQVEKKAEFLGISGMAWGLIGAGLLIIAIVWAFFRDSGGSGIF